MTGSNSGEPINPGDYEDPTLPPPGYRAITCPDCAEPTLKSTAPRLAVGPIPGVKLAPGHATSFCRLCRGRQWIWYRLINLDR